MKRVELDASDMFGKGSTRNCYLHPDDPSLCVKVSNPTAKARKDQRREVRYFRKLHSRRVDLSQVAAFLGRVETNFGPGYLYELVRDESGEVSKTLAHYFEHRPEWRPELMRGLGELGAYLLAQRIVTTDFRAHNVLCPVDSKGPGKLVIIDGVCDPARISMPSWMVSQEQGRVQRRWLRGMARLRSKYPWMADWPEV